MTRSITVRRVLAASAVAEAGTGIVLAVAPALVTSLLFGVDRPARSAPSEFYYDVEEDTPFSQDAGIQHPLGTGESAQPGAAD